MTPERWAKIEQIFDAALDRPPAVRAAFVRENAAMTRNYSPKSRNSSSGTTRVVRSSNRRFGWTADSFRRR